MFFDEHERLVTEAQLAVCVMVNGDITDLELVDAKAGTPLSDETARDFIGRGLRFIGCIGVVQGVPRNTLTEPLDPIRLSALGAAFAEYCRVLLEASWTDQQQKGDEVDWIFRLWALKDDRPDA